MISGASQHSNNIFAQSSSSMSRLRSSGGGRSESDMKALSKKDTDSITQITKDELAYEIDDLMFEQGKEWEDEEFERVFGTFS